MAAIMRSAVGRAACRALSMEGTLSVRSLHASCSSNSTRTVNPAKVDPLVKKIEGVATKKALIECIESLARDEKSQIMSPNLMGVALPCFVAISFVGVFLSAHWVGFCQATEEGYHASTRKQA